MYKRLKTSKTIKSEEAEKLSLAVKNRIEESVRAQNINLMKLSDSDGEAAAEIKNSSYYMLKTCHDMNEYFSIISGSYKIVPENTELCEFIEKFCNAAEHFVKRKGFGIMHNFACGEIFVKADKNKLCYAAANIVLNALENSVAGTKIKISASASG